MKNLLLMMLAFSCFLFAGENQKKPADSDDGHTMISVPTIQCGMCVDRITKALERVDGVELVKIDLEKKVTHVKYNPGETTLKALEKTISDLGYDANDMKRNENSHNELPECCKLTK